MGWHRRCLESNHCTMEQGRIACSGIVVDFDYAIRTGFGYDFGEGEDGGGALENMWKMLRKCSAGGEVAHSEVGGVEAWRLSQ